jgi:hypothetical protein
MVALFLIEGISVRKTSFLPFNVIFCYVAPAVFADWETLVPVIDVDFNIRIFTFSVPRIFTNLDHSSSEAIHV